MSLLAAGVAPATTKAYGAGVTGYQRFAEQHQWVPYPVTTEHLLDFSAYMSTRASQATFRVYLQGLQHHHVVQAMPLAPFLDPRVGLLMQGIARAETRPPTAKVRNATTPDDLRRVYQYLRYSGTPTSDQAMLWCAVILVYWFFPSQ